MRILFILFLIFMLPTVTFANKFDVGFLSPSGLNKEFVDKVNFAMINVYNENQLEENLKIAKSNNLMLFLDLGPSLNTSRDNNDIRVIYKDSENIEHTKMLTPLDKNKLRKLPSQEELKIRINKYVPLIKEYKSNISAIFLADEPYLNGLNKSDLESVANSTRKILNDNNLNNIKLGVIFASAMFNKSFAKNLDSLSAEYVKTIDNHYNEIVKKKQNNLATDEEIEWLQIIERNRLTTYDSAGNIYTDGGIPKGFDIYSFDFYLSTILLDNLYHNVPAWLASQKIEDSCDVFNGKTMWDIKSELSFFRTGSMNTTQDDIHKDKEVLDSLYSCRMGVVLQLLENEIKKTSPNGEIVLISESSSNGVMEFDPQGNIKTGQPEKLIELRVLNEVKRAINLMKETKHDNITGVMFFLFNDEYDKTIKINIGGAASMPSVLNEIYSLK